MTEAQHRPSRYALEQWALANNEGDVVDCVIGVERPQAGNVWKIITELADRGRRRDPHPERPRDALARRRNDPT
ncbi:hypothetical protein ABZT03_35120 [Streptomyces sp. NPDC005574]|uniref:hypothetical protein n=1 Tax=Streptomyces sp. NPDC005574 TaxID=3156891 RepID=UPI0033BFAD6D